MRRPLILLLCAMLLLTALPVRAEATDEEAELVIGEAAGRRGDQVTLEVSLGAGKEIASGGFNIVYDRTSLTLVQAEAGEALAGRSSIINDTYASNKIRFTFAGSQPLSEAGVVLRLTFLIGKYASLGKHPITAEQVKLMDLQANVVVNTAAPGGVTVRAASMALSSASCIPGQDVQLDVLLTGDLAPCGGEFEVRYDAKRLTAASVSAETMVGGVPISLTYKVQPGSGNIKVIWAASEPVSATGKLCTLCFATSAAASGKVQISFANVLFYDEKGSQAESYASSGGSISFTVSEDAQPVLYVIGGYQEENGTAVVQVVADGAGVVCGGDFWLLYDAGQCTLQSITPKTEAVVVNHTDGAVSAAWSHGSPAADPEILFEAVFLLKNGAASLLQLEDVCLYGVEGVALENVEVCDGEIGVSSELQISSAYMVQAGAGWVVKGALVDTKLDEVGQAKTAVLVSAAYREGKMISASLSAEELCLDENGVVRFTVSVPYSSQIDCVKIFAVNPDGKFQPLCKARAITQ